ncbi:transposase [Parafilimonas terrae]|uniref:REP element-mobilizing transposase RayT n=1 Tax=Parafilimonas terrae TaxID=1465490 RepID=A0A1I5UEB0_9BACT|nr:transposase [Parafilimonas terrae]SFP93601.1 REP element-mobilizing transposase RayT [Parafilimonas terrae]
MYKEPLQPGNFYHIYNRGNNKENIFKEEKNYAYFLQLWKKYIVAVADTYCYTLLPNHFHFLLYTKENADAKILSQAFSNMFNAYTKTINKVYQRTGSLFQERFGRKKITDESYYTTIIFYIHANPQKHGLTKDFTEYTHSSYQSLLSEKPTLLNRQKVFEWFGNKKGFVHLHLTNKNLSDNFPLNL